MASRPPHRPSIRNEYDAQGPEAFYTRHGADYRNPHEAVIRTAILDLAPQLDLSYVLDLAAGSGEATLVLKAAGAGRIEGIDPYTGAAYTARTGLPCEAATFEQIAGGTLAGRAYSLVVCSFALHLLVESRLPAFYAAVAEVTKQLLILSPHKRPVFRADWGWVLIDERTYTTGKPEYLRCRARLYSSSRLGNQ